MFVLIAYVKTIVIVGKIEAFNLSQMLSDVSIPLSQLSLHCDFSADASVRPSFGFTAFQ